MNLFRGRISHKAVPFAILTVSLLLACFAFVVSRPVSAIPSTMNFQGRLADASGTIVPDGLYNMQFRLFTASSGGSSVWNETRETTNRVQVTNGLFSTKLGEVSAIPASLFASGNLFFEITLATPGTATCSTASCATWESAMTPRQQMSTSAYAFNSDTLDGLDSTAFAAASGSANYIQNGSSPQTANFNITGTGVAATLQAATLDTATAAALNIGTTNATSILLNKSTTLAGALTFSGSTNTTFLTPVGSSVATKINIPIYDPGSFNQIIALGLPSGAQSTSRAISLFDARTTAHQPTLAVFSPDENNTVGFSWDGSNTTPTVKSSTNYFAIQGGANIALFLNDTVNNLGELRLGNAASNTGRITLTNYTNSYLAGIQSGVSIETYTSNLMTARGTAGQCLAVASVGTGYQQLGYSDCTTTTSAINNQNASQQASSNFWISGTGRADTSLQAPIVDTASAGTLTLGGTNATSITLADNAVLGAGLSLSLTGGNSASRPGSPSEGMLYYDTDIKQLLVYANGKWQADRSSSTKVVGTSAGGGVSGAVASQAYDGADYVNTSTTSAQTVINNAITALPAGGGTVYLMEGTYVIDGAILPNTKTRIIGSGPGTIIKLKNGINAAVSAISLSSKHEVEISNLFLEGNKANNTSGTQNGIDITSSGSATQAGTTITGVTIQNFRNDGVYVSGGKSDKVTNSSIFSNTGNGVYFSSATEVTVANNTISSNTGVGVSVGGSSGSAVTGNSMRANGVGIYVQGGSNNAITGNTILASTSSSNGSGIDLWSAGTNNTISGNMISGGAQWGISLRTGTNHTNVTGNTIEANTNSAIYLTGASNNTITNNKIHNNTAATANSSVEIVFGSDNNILSNNIITDTAGTGYAVMLSSVSSTSDLNYLSNNYFSGTGAASINDGGTGTIFVNQPKTSGGTDMLYKQAASTTAFQIQNASAAALLTADTSGNILQIGSATTDATAIVFALDNYNQATDPTGVNGAMYYNTNLNKFRCYQNGAWADCITTASSGANTSLSNLASTNINAALNTTAGNLTLQTTTSGNIILNPVGTIELQKNTNVTGTLAATTSVVTPTLDTASAVALNIGTTNASVINLNQSTTIAAGKSLTLTGGNTASRPASPTEGMVYYDTTTKQLLTYANGKWQADRSDAVLVAASDSSAADKAAADYLADGDTVAAADGDQVQINSALTATSGKKVVLLAGTYTIDASISIPNNTMLAGVGNGTLITVPNAFNVNFSAIVNTDTTTGTGVILRDIKLDGNRTNQSGTNFGMVGVDFNNMGGGTGSSARKGAYISNVRSDNWYAIGTTTNCQKGVGICLNTSANNTISNSSTQGVSNYGIYLITSTSNIIEGNTSQGNSYGIYTATSSNSNTFTANLIQNNSTYGIHISNGAYNTITGNTSQDNSFDGIILNTGSNHNTVSGNTVQNNATSGIKVSNGDYNTVSGNKAHNNGGTTDNNGISLLVSASYTSITDNNISDTSCTTTCYAINVGSGVSSAYLSGNIYRTTSGTAIINDAGTGTNYSNQSKTQGGLDVMFKQAASTSAFQVQNASGAALLTVDSSSTNNRIQIGSSTTDATAIFFMLDQYNNATDPTGANGAMYYNSSTGKFRCYQNSAWADCITTDTIGANTNLSNLTSTSINQSMIANANNSIDIGASGTTWRSGYFGTALYAPALRPLSDSATALLIQNAAGSTTIFTVNTSSNNVLVGNGTDGITLGTTGIVLTGTARPDVTVTLSPEYQGAAFTGDGTNNNGSLSSDFCSGSSRQNINATVCAATETHNYYNWTTTQATVQDYDIYVRYQLPSDYSTGSLSNMKIWGWGTTGASEVVTVAMYVDGTAAACSTSSDAVTSNTTWQQTTTASPLGSCTPVAGDMVTFKVHVEAGQNNTARSGSINISYKKKF